MLYLILVEILNKMSNEIFLGFETSEILLVFLDTVLDNLDMDLDTHSVSICPILSCMILYDIL